MMGDAPGIIRHARDGKLRLLRKGILTTDTFWDSILFGGIRKDANLSKLKGLFLSGPMEQNKSDFFRIATSCSVVSTLEHNLLLTPLSAGNMWDFQRLPPPSKLTIDGSEFGHVGAPSVGLELKLRGDEVEISNGRMYGEVGQTFLLFFDDVLTFPSFHRFSFDHHLYHYLLHYLLNFYFQIIFYLNYHLIQIRNQSIQKMYLNGLKPVLKLKWVERVFFGWINEILIESFVNFAKMY